MKSMFQSSSEKSATHSSPTAFFSPRIQAKLTVNQPGDEQEKEADSMADRVMRASADQPFFAPSALQRKSIEPEKEEKENIQRQSDKEEEEPVQLKCAACEKEETQRKESASSGGGGFTASPAVASQIHATKGGGNPMPAGTRQFMESQFGADFSGVRIHTGDTASGLNRDLSAHAFTHGKDVYFNNGKYAPESGEGKRLLAHELTHVVQQGGGRQMLLRKTEPISNQSGFDQVLFDFNNFLLLLFGPDSRDSYTALNIRKIYNELKIVKSKSPGNARQISILLQNYFGATSAEMWNDIDLGAQKFIIKHSSLKIVFYDSNAFESDFFKNQASNIAKSIGAVSFTNNCKIKLDSGTPFTDDIQSPLKLAAKCSNKKADEIHLVGHLYSGVDLNKNYGKKLSKYLNNAAKVIFHGCSVLQFRGGVKKFIEGIGTDKKIIGHLQAGEAGRPMEFYEVILPNYSYDFFKETIIVLPSNYVEYWIQEKLKYGKFSELYGFIKNKDKVKLSNDVEAIIIEKISFYLYNACKNWTIKKLKREFNKKNLEPWEKHIFTKELENRKPIPK